MFKKIVTVLFVLVVPFLIKPFTANAEVVESYRTYTESIYKIDISSIYQSDANHMIVLVYKYKDGYLVSRSVYRYYKCADKWCVLVCGGYNPETMYVQNNELLTVEADLKWVPVDGLVECERVLNKALEYSKYN